MEETEDYEVNITSSGKLFYLEVIDQFYTYNSLESASRKADQLYAMAMKLANFPERGQLEETLRSLPLYSLSGLARASHKDHLLH